MNQRWSTGTSSILSLAPNQARGKESVETTEVGGVFINPRASITSLNSSRPATARSISKSWWRARKSSTTFALLRRVLANRIHDRPSRPTSAAACSSIRDWDRRLCAPRVGRLEPPILISGCSRNVPEAGAWRVEEHVLGQSDSAKRCASGQGSAQTQNLDIAMPRRRREVARVPESVKVEVHRDSIDPALPTISARMRRFTARRRRQIHDGRPRVGSQMRAAICEPSDCAWNRPVRDIAARLESRRAFSTIVSGAASVRANLETVGRPSFSIISAARAPRKISPE